MNKSEEIKKLIISNFHNRYSGILSLSELSIFLFGKDETIAHEFIASPDFCTRLCSEKPDYVCSDYCKSLSTGNRETFICKQGLTNIIIPVDVDGEIICYLGGIQAYSTEDEYKKYMINSTGLRLDNRELIARAIGSIKTASQDKLSIHQQLCNHIAKNIALDIKTLIKQGNLSSPSLSIEKEMFEKRILELEAKNMSLVVNPHFVFNTLNSIARIAYFEKAHNIEELIYCLSDLLRYNLTQGEQMHTIAAELDNMRKYLHIQKVRFKNRLSYEIEVPDQLYSIKIPNMVIQPLVDNAINHGITGNRDGGLIKIYAKSHPSHIEIFVSDNGLGFPKEIYDKIQRGEKIPGYGYCSTDTRLKGHYGDNYGLKIVKSDYSGSTVSISIPKKHSGGI